MSGEYSKIIENYINEEKKRMHQEKFRAIFEQQKDPVKISQELKFEEPSLREIVIEIMEDIKNHLPLITRAPQSWSSLGEDSVIEWGKKLGLTPAEKRLFGQYYYAEEGKKRPSFLPNEILIYDGYAVAVTVDRNNVYFSSSSSNNSRYGSGLAPDIFLEHHGSDDLTRDFIGENNKVLKGKLLNNIGRLIMSAQRQTFSQRMWVKRSSGPSYTQGY